MIFPHVRLSDLEQDNERKQKVFHASCENLKSTIRHKIRPANLIKDHPQFFLFSLLSALPLAKIFKPIMKAPIKKGGWARRVLGMGWSWPLVRMVGKAGLKYLVPAVTGTLKHALKNSQKK